MFIKNFFERYKPIILTVITIIVLALVLFYVHTFTGEHLNDDQSFIHFIDVGQGDCSLIQNNNYNILIDSGPKSDADSVIIYLKKHNIKNLDYVIATHPHEDHIGSMEAVINNFNVKTFIAPEITSDTDEFLNMIKALKNKRLKITTVKDNQIIHLDDDSCLKILYSGNLGTNDNLNNYSIVLKYDYKNTSFLFEGDAEKEVESFLISRKADLDSDILKVAHHGSSTSSSPLFIKKVSPAAAVISCGIGNDYGHPNASTLQTFNSSHLKIYRTDINGTIKMKTDGNNISVMCRTR